jgi:hypothetical protein
MLYIGHIDTAARALVHDQEFERNRYQECQEGTSHVMYIGKIGEGT